MDAVAPEYVAARRVLLDALEAMTDHLPSLILVGAQAVHHHTGKTDLNVPLMTTDADLAIDTRGWRTSPRSARSCAVPASFPARTPVTGSQPPTSPSTSWSSRIKRARTGSRRVPHGSHPTTG